MIDRLEVSKKQLRDIESALDTIHNICGDSTEMLLCSNMYTIVQRAYEVLNHTKASYPNAPERVGYELEPYNLERDAAIELAASGKAPKLTALETSKREGYETAYAGKDDPNKFTLGTAHHMAWEAGHAEGKAARMAEEPSDSPADYEMLRVWHHYSGSMPYYWRNLQAQAVFDQAPRDAIYRDIDGRWHRLAECTEAVQERMMAYLEDEFDQMTDQ